MMITDQCNNGILLVTLKLGKGNLLSLADIEKLYNLIGAAEADKEVKGLILTGSAKCFSTGLNLSHELSSNEEYPWRPCFELLDRLLIRLFGFSKPFVAAINGHSIGAGLLIQLCADWVIVEENSRIKMGFPELTIGLTLDSLMIHLAHYGFHSKRELQNILYMGELFTFDKAMTLGVVNEVVRNDNLILSAREKIAYLLRGGSEAFLRTKEIMRADAINKMENSLHNRDYMVFDSLMVKVK